MADLYRRTGCELRQLVQVMRNDQREHLLGTHPETYARFRTAVVEWMLDVADYFRLHATTAHLAAAFLDRLQPSDKFTQKEWQLLAVCCIIISAKYNECEDQVPDLYTMEEITKQRLPNETILNYELWILKKMGWKLNARTSMAFVSCFSTEGLVEIGDRSLSLPHLSLPELASKLDVQLLSLARASILDPRLRAIPRDEIAAAMLLVSRDLCTVRPLWTKRLTEMTGFEANQLAEVSAILLESIPARSDTASDLHTDRRSHGEGEDELLAIATGSLSLREAAQSPLLINKTSGGFDKASHASPTSVADMR